MPSDLRIRPMVIVILLALAAPCAAQTAAEVAVLAELEREGWFERCEAGERKGCSLFARLVALRLNPTGDPSSWGWLTKTPAETNYDGYAEDAIVYGEGPARNNVVDLIVGAGSPGARVAWQPKPRRESNRWEAPRPLSAADMEYLRPGTGGGGGGGGASMQAVLDRLAALDQRVAGVGEMLARFAPLLETAAAEATAAAGRASDLKQQLEALAARPVVVDWPEYAGTISLPGLFGGQRTITLRPREE